MYQCHICSKSFLSHRGLNGHKRIHNEVNGRLSRGSSKPSYYRYRVFTCVQCGSESKCQISAANIFCSSKCSSQHRWETVDRPRVIAGNGRKVVIRRYLIEQNGYHCARCGIDEWHGNTIILEVDHVDGNSDNNDITNLRLLCPNCHSQTETSKDRTKKNTKRNRYFQQYHKTKNDGASDRGRTGDIFNHNEAFCH